MENEKADRLKVMLEKALQPIVERLDRIEKELKEIKETNEK
ncbi:hypothetical protein [Paucisalibacillus globulus]|nr:hypothetical protein [Paucisalibacillus globulus]